VEDLRQIIDLMEKKSGSEIFEGSLLIFVKYVIWRFCMKVYTQYNRKDII